MKRKTEASPAELFRVEGVGAKGFGIIPRFAMCDPDLSWCGKALYAYLCSLAGSGNQTWPKRETILSHLGLNKGTYYEAQKMLASQGYIEVQQTRKGSRQGSNIYTLVSCPKKLSVTVIEEESRMTSRVLAKGLKAGGYGMLPRIIMQDSRICAKTKLVYAYLASYAGAGCSAFPSSQTAITHLKLNQRMWQRAIRELSALGYLEVRQRRTNGKFGVYDYFLLDVRHSPPEVKKQDTEPKTPEVRKQDTGPKAPEVGKQDTEPEAPEVRKQDTGPKAPEVGEQDTESDAPEVRKQDTEPKTPEVGKQDTGLRAPEVRKQDTEPEAPEVRKQDTEAKTPEVRKQDTGSEAPEVKKRDTETKPEVILRDTQNQDTESTDTYYNCLSTDFSSNITPSIYQQSSDATPQSIESGDRWMDYEAVKLRLSEQLKLTSEAEANAVYGTQAQGAYELLNLLSDTLAGAGKTFLIGKQEKPKEVLWKLTPEHLRYVMDSVQSQQKRIFNLRAYLLTALYHATQTYAGYQSIQNVRMEKEAKRMQEIDNNQRQMRALIARLNGE